MGNNAAFTYFEETVIKLYDQGALTLPVLDTIAENYRDTDIDSGGMRDLQTKDGKGLFQVCIELINPDFVPVETDPADPDSYAKTWTWYHEFAVVRRERWGW